MDPTPTNPPSPGDRAVGVTGCNGAPFGSAVGFVLSQLGLVIARQFSQAIASTGLDPREFALLRAIAESQGMTQNTVSDKLAIPASTLVTLIDHLEDLRFVERRSHPSDRRSRTLHVTNDGAVALRTAMRLAMEYEQNLCGDFTPLERDELLERLDRIGRRLKITPGVHPGMSMEHGHSFGVDKTKPGTDPRSL
jgi:DNA-binding MarR family transcriptional regulator